MQGLSSSVIAALRAFSKNLLESTCNAIISSSPYNLAAKSEWRRITKSDRQPAGLPILSDLYRDQEKDEAAKHSGVKAAAKKSLSSSSFGSSSVFALVYVPQFITRERLESFSVSVQMSVAALLQARKPCSDCTLAKAAK